MTLPGIRVRVTEIDTCGVVRVRIWGEEFLLVDKVCLAFGVDRRELWRRIRETWPKLPALLREPADDAPLLRQAAEPKGDKTP